MKTVQDAFVLIVCAAWAVINLALYYFIDIWAAYISTGVFILFWVVMNILIRTNKKFRDWQHKKL